MKILGLKNLFSAMMLIALMLLSACSDPQFGAVRGQKQTKAPNLQTSSFQQCSNFTLVRPQVDLLFIWDNSSSAVFINDQTRQALNRIVDNVSSRFDYHIVLAPLIRNSNPVNWNVKLVSYDTANLNPEAMSMRISKEQASSNLNFPQGSASFEPGLERTRELLSQNISNGIFRQGAYTIVVMMSTEDDSAYFQEYGTSLPNDNLKRNYADSKIEQLLCLRGNHTGSCSGPTLNSSMMRFISIVARNPSLCSSNGIANTKTGVSYEYTSNKIYSASYTNSIPQPTDQNGAASVSRGPAFGTYSAFDSNDICVKDYRGIFDSVNSVIQDTVVNHRYNRWPVAGPNASVDPATLIVRKSTGQEFYPVGPGSVPAGVSGYRYINNSNSPRTTRFFPSAGEPFTGHMVELFGDAQVTYPECLMVTSTQEREYYGFAHLTGRPLESSIELRINGALIPRCSSPATCSNGWTLEDFYQTKNIKIVSPTNTSPAFPADNKAGYFLKLYGSAIYSNGDNVNVNWLPRGD